MKYWKGLTFTPIITSIIVITLYYYHYIQHPCISGVFLSSWVPSSSHPVCQYTTVRQMPSAPNTSLLDKLLSLTSLQQSPFPITASFSSILKKVSSWQPHFDLKFPLLLKKRKIIYCPEIFKASFLFSDPIVFINSLFHTLEKSS